MEVDGKRLDDDTVSELCEPCQEGNVSTEAEGYCNDCEEYMCQSCFQSHVKMKVLRNHVLGAVDSGRNQGTKSHTEKCKKHKTENIKYYCCNHDFVGCGDCIVSYHQKCETKFIRDLAKNFEESSDFKNIVKEVDNLEELKTEIEVSLEKYRKDNTEFHDKAIHEIRNNRAKIDSWLQNVTSKVDAEEMEICKENEKVLSKLEDWIKIISDFINKVREEISIEKYKGEYLFVRVIECKSEISEFAIKSVPEIKSSLKIKQFTFEPNQSLFELTKSATLGVIKVGGGNASSNLSTGPEVENVGVVERGTERISEDSVRVELEKELEQIRQTTYIEKEKHDRLKEFYNALKKELEDRVSLLSREREQFTLATKDREQTIIRLQQENNSLKSELNIIIEGNKILVSKSQARQEQDQNTIQALQSKLKNISESYERDCKTPASQIHERQRQKVSAGEKYQLPDPRAAGFDVGKQVEGTCYPLKGRTGIVTAVYLTGFVDVKWDHNGRVFRDIKAGAKGEYDVKLL